MYGIIGQNLSHSFSAKVFKTQFGDSHKFKIIELETIHKLPEYIINNFDLKGFSVTIPYKKSIIPYISNLDKISNDIQAVNTVLVKKINNKIELFGYNTDVFGFTEAYKQFFPQVSKNAIILGTGGACDAVNYALLKLGINTIKVSRTKIEKDTITYDQLTDELIVKANIIVNATPVGMFPNIITFPQINYNVINKNHVIIDLTYNPTVTVFMKKSKENGALAFNGFKMLELQAKKAWQIWNLI